MGKKKKKILNNDRSTVKLALCHLVHSPPQDTYTKMRFYSLLYDLLPYVALCYKMSQELCSSAQDIAR